MVVISIFHRCLTKNFIILILFALSLILAPVFVSADCSKIGTTVIFINGILGGKDQVEKSLTDLTNYYKAKGNNDNVNFLLGYNPSHVAGVDDLVNSVMQAYGVSGVDYDLTNILLQLHLDLKTQKILLVGHSQGTFYTNIAYDYLIGHGVDKDSISVYNVATPASFVAGNGKYLTSSTDKVINTIAEELSQKSPNLKPLPANINLNLSDSEKADPFGGHDFSNVYLAEASDRIIGDMDFEINNLQANSNLEECFIAPKADIVYHFFDQTYKLTDNVGKYGNYAATSPENSNQMAILGSSLLKQVYNFGSDIASAATNIVAVSKLWGGAVSVPVEARPPENLHADPAEVGPLPTVVPIPVLTQQEDLQDQLDDIQEKLDVISAQVQILVAQKNAQNNISAPVVAVKDTNKDSVPKIVLASKKNNLGGGGTLPIIYPQISIFGVQVNPIDQRFVKLYNPNSDPVDLTGWYLQRKDANDTSWGSFVSSPNFNNKIIPGNGYFLISRQIPGSDILLNITLSDNNSLALKDPNGDIKDQISWTQIPDATPTPTPTPSPDPTPTPTPTPVPTLPSITSYKIIYSTFTPNGDGMGDTTSIDLEFSEQVKASLDIVDSTGVEVKNIYNWDKVTNPDAKIWDGTNIAGVVVTNGVYTIKVVMTDTNGNSVTDASKTIIVANPFNNNTAVTSSIYKVGQLQGWDDTYKNISNVFLSTPKSIFLSNITFAAGALENTASSSLSDPIKTGDFLIVATPSPYVNLKYTISVDPTTWSEGKIKSFTGAGDFIFDTSDFMPSQPDTNDYRCSYGNGIYQNVFPSRNKNMSNGSGGPCSANYPTYELNMSLPAYKFTTAGEYDFYLSECIGYPCQGTQNGDYYRLNLDSHGNWSPISPTLTPLATQLKIISDPQTILTGSSSGVFTVQAQSAMGQPTAVSNSTSVNLLSNSLTGTFLSANAEKKTCGDVLSKPTITISTGDENKSFCYKDATQGTFAITVSATDFLPDSQNIIITTSPS